MMSAATKNIAPPRPEVDLDRITAVYSELKKMQVRLDPNPIEYGPQRFNNRIAKVRAMLNRVDQIFLQTSEDLHLFQRILNAKKTYYELEKRELMVKDPRCRVGRSQQEREALADVELRPMLEEIIELEQAFHDLETLMISIKSKRTDLKDAQGRMRDQMKLIEHDISMGARWGSNAPMSEFSSSARDMDDLISVVDTELGMPPDEEDSEDDEDDEDERGPSENETTQQEIPKVEGPEVAPNVNLLGILKSEEEDPAPKGEEPVLTFGEGDEDQVAQDEILLLEGVEKIPLPPNDHAQEDADAFLEVFDPTEESPPRPPISENAGVGIDDLIASFADD